MKKVALLLVMSLTLYSCSSTVHLTSLEEAQRKVGNKYAKLHMKSGQIFDSKQIKFEEKTIWFTNPKNDSLMQIPTLDLDYIYVSHRVGGALEGLLIGGAVGVGTGYVSTSHLTSGGDEGMGKGFTILFLGAIGGLTGMSIGLAKGHEYIFILPKDSTNVGI